MRLRAPIVTLTLCRVRVTTSSTGALMFRRHAMIGLVISAGITAACTDSVVPVAPNAFEFVALRDGLRRGQCFLQLGLNGTQVEPGADGNASVTAPTGEIVTQVAVKGGIPCWFT